MGQVLLQFIHLLQSSILRLRIFQQTSHVKHVVQTPSPPPHGFRELQRWSSGFLSLWHTQQSFLLPTMGEWTGQHNSYHLGVMRTSAMKWSCRAWQVRTMGDIWAPERALGPCSSKGPQCTILYQGKTLPLAPTAETDILETDTLTSLPVLTLSILPQEMTSDHSIALWRGNLKQAITTKHESWTKIVEDWEANNEMRPRFLRAETEEGRLSLESRPQLEEAALRLVNRPVNRFMSVPPPLTSAGIEQPTYNPTERQQDEGHIRVCPVLGAGCQRSVG
ncbi:hypothetical protein EYF80_007321 [Liparis tanakae]|uniref:Uncharacterized protein n=1 Tax=Liparis tanakae TaxID=230148 RepID=A0A4Z2IX84_9TELE|nr:hypothetical protein EYF80_007321 [Liparis tanakae]